MKIKTSITINEKILKMVDKNVDDSQNRSEFIENAIIYYLKNYQRTIRDEKDADILNKNYEKLNKEAEDILSFQDW
ncbi:MAG: hypothetical protein JXB50_12925 [Spirochaetes bacterium]|nr:hypothetical protein [Spirochaetota bacterium]